MLDNAVNAGGLVISAPVYAELLAAPRPYGRIMEGLVLETGVIVDWLIDETVWREAGRAYRDYATRRRKEPQPAPRRILTDFIIGARALVRKHRLLTIDTKIYRAAFPKLDVIGL
jgi:predicted nucleic acid-binding protein